jgi:hydantoinase/carbamoylase family amidase
MHQTTPQSAILSESRGAVERLRGAPPGSVSADLAELALIGSSPEGGIDRIAWSPELFAAYDWVARLMAEDGLEVKVDVAGNLIGSWNVGHGAAVVVGSHLDTVPHGGALDGALGVVAGIHAVRLLRERGLVPPRPLRIIAFMDEEGTRFDTALFGSRAFAGDDLSALGERLDESGISLREAMASAGYDHRELGSARGIAAVHAYLELHIEQGPVLAADGIAVGAVTSIVGLRRFQVELVGSANHAGTTPMELRRDALAGAARISLAVRDFVRRRHDLTANVGKLSIEPGGANVVPGRAEFTIDVRAPDAAGIAEVEQFVWETIESIARDERLESRVELTLSLDPVQFDPSLIEATERAAAAEGASCRRIESGAGHDAMVLGQHVPTGMIFVPSDGGVSHSPDEYTPPANLELGTRVLATCLQDVLSRER